MQPDPQPLLLVIAGPNGAGKSSLRALLLPEGSFPFVNPDEVARHFFGAAAEDASYEAADIAAAVRDILLRHRRSFGFETVLSDPVGHKVQELTAAQASGYQVAVHFVGIGSAELSRLRVFQRVEQGGHDVPDDKVAARYARVMANLHRLLPIPDELVIYDNSSPDTPFRRLALLQRGQLRELSRELPSWVAFLDLPSRVNPNTAFLP